MARRVRSSGVETRAARLKRPVAKKPTFTIISPGISLGYRRNQGAGTWVVKAADGHGNHWTKAFAIADDYEDADGERVLDYWLAQDKARILARGGQDTGKPVNTADAIVAYASDLKARGGDLANAFRLRRHMTPTLLAKPVALLTASELKQWRDRLPVSPATITRHSKALKAALNLAARCDPRITNGAAWSVGLAGLPDSFVSRNVILSDDDIRRIVATAWEADPAFGLFVEVAAVTGARASQLSRLELADLQTGRDSPRLMMPSSAKGSGRKRVERRPLPIPASLAMKLKGAAAGRRPHDRLLVRPDDSPWRHGQHARPFAAIAAAVGLADVTISALRHSSIVRALLANVPVRIVAISHDTSVVMIEKTYSRYISDHADSVVRAAQIDLDPAGTTVAVLPQRG
jgi:integrase